MGTSDHFSHNLWHHSTFQSINKRIGRPNFRYMMKLAILKFKLATQYHSIDIAFSFFSHLVNVVMLL